MRNTKVAMLYFLAFALAIASCRSRPCPEPVIETRVEYRDTTVYVPGDSVVQWFRVVERDTIERIERVPQPYPDTRILWRTPEIALSDSGRVELWVERTENGIIQVKAKTRPDSVLVRKAQRLTTTVVRYEAEVRALETELKQAVEWRNKVMVGLSAAVLALLLVVWLKK